LKPKCHAADEPFVSPDHTHQPVVFNNGVMFREPVPFWYKPFNSLWLVSLKDRRHATNTNL